jgi:hypothetical protein
MKLWLDWSCSAGVPRRAGLPQGQAETVIQVTPGQSRILMTPGGKAGWSHGRADPGWEGTAEPVKGEAMFLYYPQAVGAQRPRQRWRNGEG